MLNEVPLSVYQYVMTEEKKPVIKKEMNHLEKLSDYSKGVLGINFPNATGEKKAAKFINIL